MEKKITVRVEADLEDLIPGYLENRLVDVKRISHALAAESYNEIRSISHSFKGSGAAYGFDEISLIGEKMEGAARADDRERIAELNKALLKYLEQVEILFEE